MLSYQLPNLKGGPVQERLRYWQQWGLFIVFLPPYSPHLNLAETLCRKLKIEWLRPDDYPKKDSWFYAIGRYLASVEQELGSILVHLI